MTTAVDAALLERRAERLRTVPPEPPDEERIVWAAALTLGDDVYAFPLQALRGVLPLRAVTPVPLAPPSVVGIARFQGQLLTVFSLASLLGGAWRVDATIMLVVEHPEGLFAFECGDVPTTVAIPRASAEASLGGDVGGAGPVQTLEGDTVQLIDLLALWGRHDPGRGGADRGIR